MFQNIEDTLCTYTLDTKAIENMHIYYGKKTAGRKIALSTRLQWDDETGLEVSMSQQFARDTKLYQLDNIQRKLLSHIDGFIQSRRKVLHAFRSTPRGAKKTAGAAGEVVKLADYHHGEESLVNTISLMAQAYPGARNFPILRPLGNFGTRDMGYKNYAASRYTFTDLNYRLTDKLFRREDDWILRYTGEARYEPDFYVPIFPYALCETNILPGTGWVINLHARDIWVMFKALREMIKGTINACPPLPIWNKDFSGDIRLKGSREYFVGEYFYDEKEETIHISELPPGVFSTPYLEGDPKKKDSKGLRDDPLVDDYVDQTTINGVDITIYLKPGAGEEICQNYGGPIFDSFEEFLGLKVPVYHRLNMVSETGEVVEHKTYESVFETWYKFRRDLYAVRVEREVILNDLEILMLEEMQRFSASYDSYNITSRTTDEVLEAILTKHKYKIFNKTLLTSPKYTEVEKLIALITLEENGADHGYILSMTIRDTTKEASAKRQKRIDALRERQDYLAPGDERFRGQKIWVKELDELEKVVREGLESDWFFGENHYIFESDGSKKKATKGTSASPKKAKPAGGATAKAPKRSTRRKK
jgi:DNA gyrase/topoisomerase IV subunit A